MVANSQFFLQIKIRVAYNQAPGAVISVYNQYTSRFLLIYQKQYKHVKYIPEVNILSKP